MPRLATALPGLVAVAACSAMSLRTARDDAPPSVEPDCDASYGAIAIDAVIVATAVGATFLWQEEGNRGALLYWSLPWLISGVWGVSKVHSCSALRERHRAWFVQNPPPEPPPPDAGIGEERGDCLPGGRCADGLVCASWLCVRRPARAPRADGGVPAGAGMDAGADDPDGGAE